MVLCSSSKSEASWESKKYPNGVFTHTLIEALQQNGDKTKLSDAFTFLKNGVQAQVAAERGVMQTPILEMSKWKGKDILLAAMPTNPRKPPEPLITADDSESNNSQPGKTSDSNLTNSSTPPNAKPAAFIPDITGDYLGTNNLHYVYWQKGRKCGWEMPQFGESGKCTISEDGKTLSATWTGPLVGSGIYTLECDSSGRVIRMLGDGGFVATRVSP